MARASGVAMNLVPIHTPSAPNDNAAASPRPAKITAAATTGIAPSIASTMRGTSGTVATLPLVPLIVDAMDGAIPVVAAGGIFDGRGLAAALSLGADGVWIGTRFIATPEARAIPGYRETILETREDGTVVSRAFSGKTMRVLRNDTTDRYDADPSLLKKFPDQLA